MSNHYDIAVVGNWHLSSVTAGVLSSVGYKTLLVNPDTKNQWQEFPQLPVHEPGLPEMYAESRKNNLLDFTNGVTDQWTADRIWMAIDTPVNDRDEADVTPLIEVTKLAKKYHANIKAFIISSQIPIGFSTALEKELGLPFVYIPENLRLGQGIETFFKADRTVIGATKKETAEATQKFLEKFPTEFVLCNLETAEMIKHANNAFLATSISFANELARIGEKFGADGALVAKAMKLDKRIGNKAYVAPGLGFAGGTLPRDVRILQKLGKEYHIPMRMMDAVMDINEDTTSAIGEIVERRLKEKNSKKVLILGYTYKADTDTLRRSLSIDIAQVLTQKGYQVEGFDPVMNGKDISAVGNAFTHKESLNQIKERPEVILLMTGRSAFKELHWSDLAKQWGLKKGSRSLILDTQNFLNADTVLSAGFEFKKLWSSHLTPKEG